MGPITPILQSVRLKPRGTHDPDMPGSLREEQQSQELSSSLSDAQILLPSRHLSPPLREVCLWPQECGHMNLPLPQMSKTCVSD